MSKLFLSGGGDVDMSYSFDSLFFDSLPQAANILYIPVAMATTMTKTEVAFDWFSKLISRHSSNNRYLDFTIWNIGDSLPILHNYDAVYVGGGNTYRLLMALEKSGMFDALKKYIRNGGIYYGGSAGAVIVGKNLRTVEEENLENYSKHDGMNLVEDLSIFPHFSDSEEQKNTIRNICGKYSLKVVALPENSGLILDTQSIGVHGNIYLYEQEKETIFYTSGQIIK
jgi:dipeptidase E